MSARTTCARTALLTTLICLSLWSTQSALAAHPTDRPAAAQAEAPTTPIQHFVVLMEEDRSFDSYFADYPGASSQADSTCVQLEENSTQCQRPFALGNKPATPLSALQQKYVGAFTLGHYGETEVPYFWNLADQYVLFDHYFSSVNSTKGAISPNKFYAIAGTASTSTKLTTGGYDRINTIFDRLQDKGVSWKVYVQDYDPNTNFRSVKAGENVPGQVSKVPVLSFNRFIDNPRLAANIVDIQEYYRDLQQDQLPAVSFLYIYGASEPKASSLIVSQRHLKNVSQALMRSTAWSSSALLWTHDQSGGWYDHLPLPETQGTSLGARVPAMLISPFARSGHVDSTVLEHSAIVKFIQTNWKLIPLEQRDRQANSFLEAFDFTQLPREAEFLPMTRVQPKITTQPSRLWIFILYGGAVTLAIVALAVVLTRHPKSDNNETPLQYASKLHRI